jgi:hypothetical protein
MPSPPVSYDRPRQTARSGFVFAARRLTAVRAAVSQAVFSRVAVARASFAAVAIACFVAVFLLRSAGAQQDVQLVPIDGVRQFPEATEPRAIQYACAASRDLLPAFFTSRGLSFEPNLVRRREGHAFCHIYYEPTLPGFHASPEDGTVSELFGAVDPVSFVVRRKPIGDSLDIIKAVLEQLPQPIRVTLSSPEQFEAEYWPEALEYHFPKTRHDIRILRSEAETTHPWAQDYVKPGVWNGERRILTPRRLFEGRGGDGETFRPLLEAFRDGPFVRSKLSWEGGDLQFVADPKDPSKRILLYGGSARAYWGPQLEPRDYEYVLRSEFGADRALDLTRIGPHADYMVAALPADGTALLAWPVRENYTLARAAAAELLSIYGRRAPRRLVELARLFDDPAAGIAEDPERPAQLIAWLRQALSEIPGAPDGELMAAQAAYISQNCPDDPVACFAGAGGRLLLRRNRELFERLADDTADQQHELTVAPVLLALIANQLPGAATLDLDLIAQKEKELRQLGFRVVRVPHLIGQVDDWPGVSYINHLRVGRTLFVPALGLPSVEEPLFADLRRKLGADYRIIPVPARSSLVNNGGVHCVFGIVPELGASPGSPVAAEL